MPLIPPTRTTISTTLSNFILPNQVDYTTPFFLIPQPTTNNPGGAFTYSSSNTNIIQIYNNIGIITGVGNVTITATQASYSNFTTIYTSSNISSNINIISYLNSSNNNNFLLKIENATITNYNPITNIQNTDNEWLYFKYYINSTHKISSNYSISNNNIFKSRNRIVYRGFSDTIA
jgi:hypothetical protein